MLHLHRCCPWLCLVFVLAGCKSAYYGTWEKLGWHKRDILVDRVKDARDDQKAAKEQFQTTLERFVALAQVDVGDLQKRYDKLKADYDRCQSRARAVTGQIHSVETVARDLFREWEQELGQYSSPDLRRASEQKLRETQQRCEQLITAMRRAEQKMKPVLAAFGVQVLFLKHNLNAAAIAALQQTASRLEGDVAALIGDMEASINEANQFIQQMQ